MKNLIKLQRQLKTIKMKITKTNFESLMTIESDIFDDERGYFFESYNKGKFDTIGINIDFVLDTESFSKKSVLRGFHFQKPPFPQGKLIRVVYGRVLDVVIDLRKKSPTYGRWFSIVLSAANKKMLWIPPGFAHGFLVLEDDTILSYKLTAFHNKEAESGILWSDSDLNVDWKFDKYGIERPILSEKDKKLPLFKEIDKKNYFIGY